MFAQPRWVPEVETFPKPVDYHCPSTASLVGRKSEKQSTQIGSTFVFSQFPCCITDSCLASQAEIHCGTEDDTLNL